MVHGAVSERNTVRVLPEMVLTRTRKVKPGSVEPAPVRRVIARNSTLVGGVKVWPGSEVPGHHFPTSKVLPAAPVNCAMSEPFTTGAVLLTLTWAAFDSEAVTHSPAIAAAMGRKAWMHLGGFIVDVMTLMSMDQFWLTLTSTNSLVVGVPVTVAVTVVMPALVTALKLTVVPAPSVAPPA